MRDFFITIDELKALIGTSRAPMIYDVHRRDIYAEAKHILPTARWREHTRVTEWASEIPPGASVVAYCAHGHNVSQLAVSALREMGLDARALEGGIEGWRKVGGLTILKAALPGRDEARPSRWVTRVRPKIDRIACPWLIRRFIDAQAQFFFVEPSQVTSVAKELAGIPYDIEGVEIGHDGELCSFDTLIRRFAITDPALASLALVVRGADTARPDLAPEAAGLLAVSLGNSALCGGNDHAALRLGFPVYDALYAWRRYAASETHNWPAKRS